MLSKGEHLYYAIRILFLMTRARCLVLLSMTFFL
jgi:hypothetical protein